MVDARERAWLDREDEIVAQAIRSNGGNQLDLAAHARAFPHGGNAHQRHLRY